MATKDEATALAVFAKADAVCFDVDSTVVTGEGIDELAEHCGAGEAVAEWTRKAMGGGVDYRTSLAARLDLFKPSLAQIAECLRARPLVLTPGVKTLMDALKAKGCAVFLVSGGFRQVIEPLAVSELGIPKERVFANNLLFDPDGEYIGFDPDEPTASTGGKPRVCEQLKGQYGFKTVAMIGDGATDMEAKRDGAADVFIGFGGNVTRPDVKAGCDAWITDFGVLTAALTKAA
jgi:phosphoserine phosphatase